MVVMLTLEQLREELHRELDPMREDIREMRADVRELRSGMADVRVELEKRPTKAEMRDLVVDKVNAMKGGLLAWILGTALALAGFLKFVPGPGSGA